MITEFATAHVETPVGIVELRGTSEGLSTVTFLNEVPSALRQDSELVESVSQLREYFAGDRTAFHSLKLRYAATDFQQSVWDELMRVPFGETVTYGELAERAGHSGAARAVGTAMNVNPLPIIIPCHRVLPANRTLGQYACGPERKLWLLQLEKTAMTQTASL